MSGTVYSPILVYPGEQVSFDVLAANIALGSVVAIDAGNDMAVVTGTEALKALAIGVASACRSTSSQVGSSTQLEAVIGEKVTVVMRGVVNLTAASNITAGNTVEAANSGQVAPGTTNILGIALEDITADSVGKIFLRGY